MPRPARKPLRATRFVGALVRFYEEQLTARGRYLLWITLTFALLVVDQRWQPLQGVHFLPVSKQAKQTEPAQGMARSRAGLAITIVAVAAVFALGLPERGQAGAKASLRGLSLALGLAVALVAQFALYGILERFGTVPLARHHPVARRSSRRHGDAQP